MLGRGVTRRLSLPSSLPGRLLLVVLVVVLVAAGAVAGLAVAGRGGGVTALVTPTPTTSPPPAPLTPAPVLPELPAAAPVPAPAALAGVLDPLAASPALGELSGQVADAATGQVLWSRAPDVPQTPASTAKLLTVAAALWTLPVDHTVATRVVAGADPGQVVLVGGGDVTLTGEPAGTPGSYDGAPRLDDLVAAVRAARGPQAPPVTSVLVDTSAWSGPTEADGWFDADVAGGYIAPMEPVMLDAAREDPAGGDSARSATPALDVGRALASRLGAAPDVAATGTAPAGAALLGEVRSAPLVTRLDQLVRDSDNVLAEAVGREVAVARAQPASFTGATTAVLDTLREHGIDPTGVTLADTSGLSVRDRVPPRVLDAIVTAAAGPGDPALADLVSFLPVAAASGTLADRFPAAGAGWVRAKTGTLTGVNSLAGTVTDVDGRLLTFALMSTGVDGARPALDALAAALRGCGCR
ncbi:D-alanyl-D-alanine carboxypeptidase/D-alanyl-D-alanine-endopeptidase [Rhodococcus aerolatus]